MSVELFLGDALMWLNELDDQSVDAVICDPPYGATQNKWDSIIPLDDLWPQLFRICKGAIVLTAIQPFSSILVLSQIKFFKHEWVWEKNKSSGHLNCKTSPLRAHETVLVFSRNGFAFNPQKTSGHKPGNYAVQRTMTTNYGAQTSTVYGGQTERYPRSVQKFSVLNNDSPERIHPTQKPVSLMEYLISTYTNVGDTVLDFAMGSGTTGEAAINLGRKFIGIELEPKFFDHAKKRLTSQLEPDQLGATQAPRSAQDA